MKLLIVEDDKEGGEILKNAQIEAGRKVTLAADGVEAFQLALCGNFDVIILDRMLPGMDGLEVLRRARGAGISTPVLMLTALDSIDDRVEGLQAGADDYLVKPFAMAELNARLEALSRRLPLRDGGAELRVGDLHMDLISRKVTRAGQKLDLQPKEFLLLEQLMRAAGALVTRSMLLEKVWNFHFDPRTNIVETHISRLRRKLDDAGPPMIHTVRGGGYILREPMRH